MDLVEPRFAASDETGKFLVELHGDLGTGTSKSGAVVLIVEDEFFVATHLEALLNELSFTNCAIAANPEEAITRALELEPALMLVDVNLSADIDGIEMVRRVRERRSIAVVFVTAYTDVATLSRIKRAIPNAPVLHKPISVQQLKVAIDQSLGSRS